MEFDLSVEEREAICHAITEWTDECVIFGSRLQERLYHFVNLLEDCGEVGTTFHVN